MADECTNIANQDLQDNVYNGKNNVGRKACSLNTLVCTCPKFGCQQYYKAGNPRSVNTMMHWKQLLRCASLLSFL